MAKGDKGGYKNIQGTGKGFASCPENINREGRPPSRFKGIMKKYIEAGAEPMTKDDFIFFLGIVMNFTEKEIDDMALDIEAPYWMRLVCKDISNGEMRQKVLTDFYDRVYGKAKETHEFKGEIKGSVDMFRDIKVVVNGKVK